MRRLIQTISFKNFASMQYEAEKGSLLIDVFIDEIIKFSNSEENPETVYRVLNYTRFHLCSQTVFITIEQPKLIRNIRV